ncbi:unnamed protein product [Schistosoma mattheei]|uniref:Uncharacterized protein n=1 Tax=Schistosoma mattheei TaxID=31246 RepID=A0A183P3V2_9TREM|nr:unnamed protein product [Schistosoma mattheei]
MFFNCRNAALDLPTLDHTSSSDPPCSSMMLPRYVKDFTSSRASPSSVNLREGLDFFKNLKIIFMLSRTK